jgi:hypothetical protein
MRSTTPPSAHVPSALPERGQDDDDEEASAVLLATFEGGAIAALRLTFDAGPDQTRLSFCGGGVTAAIVGTEADPTASAVAWSCGDRLLLQRLVDLEQSTDGSVQGPLIVPFLGRAIDVRRRDALPGQCDALPSIETSFRRTISRCAPARVRPNSKSTGIACIGACICPRNQRVTRTGSRRRSPRPSVRRARGRKARIHRRVNATRKRMSWMRARIPAGRLRLHRSVVEMKRMGTRMSWMRARIACMGTRMSWMRARIPRMGTRMRWMRACISWIRTRTRWMRARTPWMHARMCWMRARIPWMGTRMSWMHARIPRMGTRMSWMHTRIPWMHERMRWLEWDLPAVDESVQHTSGLHEPPNYEEERHPDDEHHEHALHS